MRAKYQVLIIPFKKENNQIKYGIFKRKDMSVWQGVAGGGEEGETILQSAKREFYEETGINAKKMIKLDSRSTIPAFNFKTREFWGKNTYVVDEFSFGVEITNEEIKLSEEHTEYKFVSYEEADQLFKWDSNKTALWELNERLGQK